MSTKKEKRASASRSKHWTNELFHDRPQLYVGNLNRTQITQRMKQVITLAYDYEEMNFDDDKMKAGGQGVNPCGR